MKTAVPMQLADHEARVAALSHHNRSLLVEAGAGSGKTAVLAGRVALLLANGVAPCNIAAVSFTELSAAELMGRVHAFVVDLNQGKVPVELRLALADGVSEEQVANLAAALDHFDELTCTTIHGFCQQLIAPYPAEANIDPGASVIDAAEADVLFDDLLEIWLREMLDAEGGGMLARLIAQDPGCGLTLAREVAGKMRRQRDAVGSRPQELATVRQEFSRAAQAYADCLRGTGVDDAATSMAVRAFTTMGQRCDAVGDAAAYLFIEAVPELCRKDGQFKAWKNKGNWRTSAKAAGKATALADVDYESLAQHHQQCCDAWMRLKECVVAIVLATTMDELNPLLARFAAAKRDAAMLDFDDLLFAARDLLRGHEQVRHALSRRYRHVLVDEFQDTDPLQLEIFWRLCGDDVPGTPDDWLAGAIRPGALFLVGDPKQAIYRFRGADIAAYTTARDSLRRADPDSVLSICTNFRSLAPILDHVNACFEAPLNAEGQPGFTALQAGPDAASGNACVVALDLEAAGNAEAQRDLEAEAVAELCATLIGSYMVKDRSTGEARACQAGDIALLAPGSTDLWRYEGALERRGIPVASQAGKGFFLRQEVQDLVALTRTLADPRDTLALGALLRGPLIGLSEEELLDVVWDLPREADARTLPRLTLHTDTTLIGHPLLCQVLGSLQALRRIAESTTPSLLLAQAVDALNVRAVLQQRHRRHAERALCNVDRFIDMARAYIVRGLGAFAADMSKAWEDASRVPEGQVDSLENAVTLYTMHAAKGLEWPIVMPINTLTQVQASDGTFVARSSGVLHCRVFGGQPPGYDTAREEEETQLAHERLRLWYVAATRARELLILPRHAERPGVNVWAGLCDFGLENLPAFSCDPAAQAHARAPIAAMQNRQNADVFNAERQQIAAARRAIEWRVPSRHEVSEAAVAAPPEMTTPDAFAEDGVPTHVPSAVQGGATRGRVLHKLFEEVLTGETEESLLALRARGAELISELGLEAAADPMFGLAPDELAHCVLASLALPEIRELRPSLMPEFGVWSTEAIGHGEVVQAGVIDAISFDSAGQPDVVVDWKSDVAPSDGTLAHYCAQVGSYMKMIGAKRGLIVLATSQKTIWIS